MDTATGRRRPVVGGASKRCGPRSTLQLVPGQTTSLSHLVPTRPSWINLSTIELLETVIQRGPEGQLHPGRARRTGRSPRTPPSPAAPVSSTAPTGPASRIRLMWSIFHRPSAITSIQSGPRLCSATSLVRRGPRPTACRTGTTTARRGQGRDAADDVEGPRSVNRRARGGSNSAAVIAGATQAAWSVKTTTVVTCSGRARLQGRLTALDSGFMLHHGTAPVRRPDESRRPW